MIRRKYCAALIGMMLLAAAPVHATPHEISVPLQDGKLCVANLATVLTKLNLPSDALPTVDVDLRQFTGSLFVTALNKSLGAGCDVSATADALVLKFDLEKLPRDETSVKHAIRTFTATAAPEATANQQRLYGLWMPANLDSHRPLVILVHGLDSDRATWQSMADLLIGSGHQVAYFSYASDQAVADSVAAFSDQMKALRETFPQMPVDVIAHSLGAIVTRGYIEGPDYAGGVDRFIMLGPPNHGSKWASLRFVLEVQEHFHLWQHEPDWSPTWMITDGLGEAGRDLKPHSAYLTELNSRPRRVGVKYTIIAGGQNPLRKLEADSIDNAAKLVPSHLVNWWAPIVIRAQMHTYAESVRNHMGKSDGPVEVKSCRLEGVSDFVVVPAGHIALYESSGPGIPPVAWAAVAERLK